MSVSTHFDEAWPDALAQHQYMDMQQYDGDEILQRFTIVEQLSLGHAGHHDLPMCFFVVDVRLARAARIPLAQHYCGHFTHDEYCPRPHGLEFSRRAQELGGIWRAWLLQPWKWSTDTAHADVHVAKSRMHTKVSQSGQISVAIAHVRRPVLPISAASMPKSSKTVTDADAARFAAHAGGFIESARVLIFVDRELQHFVDLMTVNETPQHLLITKDGQHLCKLRVRRCGPMLQAPKHTQENWDVDKFLDGILLDAAHMWNLADEMERRIVTARFYQLVVDDACAAGAERAERVAKSEAPSKKQRV
jgi:hypothetical protein